MGAWGSGHFDNDAAMDLVADVLQVATAEIEAFCASDRCAVEDLDAVMACVAVHLALNERCRARHPDVDIARGLREKVMRLYDEGVDALKPNAEYKRARRAALVETLASYEQAAREAD